VLWQQRQVCHIIPDIVPPRLLKLFPCYHICIVMSRHREHDTERSSMITFDRPMILWNYSAYPYKGGTATAAPIGHTKQPEGPHNHASHVWHTVLLLLDCIKHFVRL
jgi:hypothetical protein